jgi:hypothetical protein
MPRRLAVVLESSMSNWAWIFFVVRVVRRRRSRVAARLVFLCICV